MTTAATPASRTFPAPEGPLDVRVRLGSGRLEVAVGPGPVSASVEAQDPSDARAVELAASAAVELTGDRLSIATSPRHGRSRPLLVRLTVPATSRLDVHCGDLELVADGELADVRLHSGNVELDLPAVSGSLDVKAGNLDLRAGRVARASLTSGNGTVRVQDAGDLALKTGNGRVVLARTTGDVVVKGGNVELDLAELASGSVTTQTGAGSARVGVAAGLVVALDLASGMGRVRCDLPVEAQAPAGSGTADLPLVQVRLRTGLGDVTVAPAG